MSDGATMTDPAAAAHVTSTLRADIRLGDDAVTLEVSMTLPLDADDTQLEQALQLSRRLHERQYPAFARQLQQLRESAAGPPREVEASAGRDVEPASDRQHSYLAALQEDHGWSVSQLRAFARRHGCEPATLTRRQAALLIEELRRSPEAAGLPAEVSRRPILARQRHALTQIAAQRGLDLAAEVLSRYGCSPEQLTADQAAQLLQQWQVVPARSRFDAHSR
jgi:hypothetical protein